MSSGTRPPSFSLSWNALLSLPMRICNPPPAASRVRSCQVTPLVKVTLDDVLNRRHLPPLTLKDFEEWLVFVEGSPQYLYFLLWLKEYESRYAAWLADSGCTLPVAFPTNSTTTFGDDVDPDTHCTPCDRDLSYINLIPSSAPLALFFTRAKQTFLDPTSNSPYALGHAALVALSPSTHSLAPSIPQFTVPKEYGGSGYAVGSLPASLAVQPHPHPKELAPLAIYARKILKECLERFAETACQNVGTRRAWCGVAGGTFIALVIGILPALAALFFAPCRWWRVVGWFGCWLGGTIIVSSFHGICMMIYVFGDLRQLRSFELARPSISGPRAIARARPRLKSFFSREGKEEATDIGDRGTGTEIQTEKDSAPAQPSASTSSRNIDIPAAPRNSDENKGKEIPKGKRLWSARSASQTSTGTPVVHFGAGAFKFGVDTGTTESDISATTGNGDIIVGEINDAGAQLNEDDFGIEISPAYYYSGHGPTGEGEKTERRESARSAGSGSRIGLVMQWVLGRRGSVGIGTGAGTKVASVANEKTAQLQSQTKSHAGTFGIKSWQGGLGCLPEDGRGIEGLDLEKGINLTRTVEDEQPLDEPEIDEDAGLELQDMLTAEFITHDYPELKPQPAVVPCTNPEPPNMPRAEVEKEKTPVEKKRESSFISPIKFDFDKLPTATAARRMSSPCTFASSVFPYPGSDRALTTPEPILVHPPPAFALYTHPGARLTTPTPALSLVIPCPRPVSTAKDRQWWDTCPRHPAVEATLASETRSPTLAVQTQNPPRPSSFLCPTHPALMLALASGDSSTRPTSLASSDVHSRMRANLHPVPATSTHKSSPHPRMSFGSSRCSETWQTRFRRVMAVPAFGPLTRVLEPVVSRGQWEIVVRSACAAVLGAWIITGCLVALPEVR